MPEVFDNNTRVIISTSLAFSVIVPPVCVKSPRTSNIEARVLAVMVLLVLVAKSIVPLA